MTTLSEDEILVYLNVCAYTLSESLQDSDSPRAAEWAVDDARWLWERNEGLKSEIPYSTVVRLLRIKTR